MKLMKFGALALAAMMLVGCGAKKDKALSLEELKTKSWQEVREVSDGTEVYFYGWGGSQQINDWLDNVVAPTLKMEHNITLKRVPMNIDEVLNKLVGEKQAEAEGTIDMVWINGENFFTAKENNLMAGSFTSSLPNYQSYVNQESRDVLFDFGYKVDGMEAPYGKAQFVMVMDSAFNKDYPKNPEALKAWVQANPGKFTYPAPPDFTGSAFVRNLAYEILGEETVLKAENLEKEEAKEVFAPVMAYLNEIKPYLWNEGKSYPATSSQQESLFEDGEVRVMMSYNPNHVAAKINSGEYPDTVESYLFDGGTLGNTHFITIPFNSPNKAGALVAINEILSPLLQASKYDAKQWGDLPVLDYSLLGEEEKALFDKVPLGQGVVPQDLLLSKRVAEPSAKVALIIEELWLEEVGKQ